MSYEKVFAGGRYLINRPQPEHAQPKKYSTVEFLEIHAFQANIELNSQKKQMAETRAQERTKQLAHSRTQSRVQTIHISQKSRHAYRSQIQSMSRLRTGNTCSSFNSYQKSTIRMGQTSEGFEPADSARIIVQRKNRSAFEHFRGGAIESARDTATSSDFNSMMRVNVRNKATIQANNQNNGSLDISQPVLKRFNDNKLSKNATLLDQVQSQSQEILVPETMPFSQFSSAKNTVESNSNEAQLRQLFGDSKSQLNQQTINRTSQQSPFEATLNKTFYPRAPNSRQRLNKFTASYNDYSSVLHGEMSMTTDEKQNPHVTFMSSDHISHQLSVSDAQPGYAIPCKPKTAQKKISISQNKTIPKRKGAKSTPKTSAMHQTKLLAAMVQQMSGGGQHPSANRMR